MTLASQLEQKARKSCKSWFSFILGDADETVDLFKQAANEYKIQRKCKSYF